jgi:transcriptional regulator with GAF, ATPase, and Fis domain
VALEDGDVARAAETLARARELVATDETNAEVVFLGAAHARARGVGHDELLALGASALAAARHGGNEEIQREVHVLLAEVHRAGSELEAARAHIEHAAALRDRLAATLSVEIRNSFLAHPNVAAIARVQATLEPAISAQVEDEPRASRRGSASGDPWATVRAQATARELVGDDPAIRGLLQAIRKVARSNATVLVRGESGTGKELVAEALHAASDRASGPLVTVNCAALVETLLLSELFGHEKGAFTGAFARRRGRFEMAEGGTLFLDEIGDISPRTQVALLRVLQERTFERVGGTTAIRANVRIVCATHRDLRSMVERSDFREDLYYRLRGITLEVPALRHRMGDVPRIADSLLRRIAVERGEPPKALGADALDLLARHRWPGNVRELENALRAASLFAEGATITLADLANNVDDLRALAVPVSVPSIRTPVPAAPVDLSPSEDEGEGTSGPLPTVEANATGIAYAQVRQGAVSLSDMKRQIERDCIARALAETKGNITRAAALLGMKRPRLSQLVKQYGLVAVSSEGT